MLDVALRSVTFRYSKSDFAIEGLDAHFKASSHTAIVGPPAAGLTTILRIIAGDLRPQSGELLIGSRPVRDLRRSERPILYATSEPNVPGRWSVRHALVAAARSRRLDRTDRHREYLLAVEHWHLDTILDRRIDTLSSTERTTMQLARIELLRPAILVADRFLEHANRSTLVALADDFYRTLRVMGTTVITVPATFEELGITDRVMVMDRGRITQSGAAAEIWRSPSSEAAAAASGEVNIVPITIRGRTVESVIGAWELDDPPFDGTGVALARPEDFHLAAQGEESDLIFGIEEASFHGGRWLLRGFLTGGIVLRVRVDAYAAFAKGRLIPLRYDPRRFRLLARVRDEPRGVPTDAIPSIRDSR